MARRIDPRSLIRAHGEMLVHAAWRAVVADSLALPSQAHAPDCPVRHGIRTQCAYGGQVCVSEDFHVRLLDALAAGQRAIEDL